MAYIVILLPTDVSTSMVLVPGASDYKPLKLAPAMHFQENSIGEKKKKKGFLSIRKCTLNYLDKR